MDIQTARSLSALTTEFYQRTSESFSDTRRSAWPGWERLLEVPGLASRDSLRVLDLGCGNLRFERYLAVRGVRTSAWAVDNCDDLASLGVSLVRDESRGSHGLNVARDVPDASMPAVEYQHLDIMECLYAGRDLSAAIGAPAFDLCVAFGFMHHIPLSEHRMCVLRALVDHAQPDGYVALSFWQFGRDARIMAKAQRVAQGDEGDYLLGWQGQAGLQRYCHSFSEEEVDELVASVASRTREVARYSADGKRGDLNRYIVLEALSS